MDGVYDAEATIIETVPAIVRRHRSVGVLTWRLLHEIEEEALAEVAATGRHSRQILNMLRSSGLMGYPRDERAVSFEGHEVLPMVFSQIKDAWDRVD